MIVVKTYQEILSDMLDEVGNEYDKREGSVIYDALAPAAAELAQLYISLQSMLNETFAGTATGAYLERITQEQGINRIPATYAVVRATVTPSSLELTEGTRFSCGDVNYAATEKVSAGVYLMQCETAGTGGNKSGGRLIPINNIPGFTSAVISLLSIEARNEETDAELRERYFANITDNAKDGNKAQYEAWCREINGVGNFKVFPLGLSGNVPNTVRVSVLNEDNDIASADLIAAFQEYLDPDSEGLGNGKAPIGAIVTVSTATHKNVALTATVTLESGYSIDDVSAEIENNIKALFRSQSYKETSVSYFTVASDILLTQGVESLVSLNLNGTAGNVALGKEEIPYLSACTVTEAV